MTFTSKAIAASALLILLCVGTLSFQSSVRDQEDRGWVTQTHIVIETLQVDFNQFTHTIPQIGMSRLLINQAPSPGTFVGRKSQGTWIGEFNKKGAPQP